MWSPPGLSVARVPTASRGEHEEREAPARVRAAWVFPPWKPPSVGSASLPLPPLELVSGQGLTLGEEKRKFARGQDSYQPGTRRRYGSSNRWCPACLLHLRREMCDCNAKCPSHEVWDPPTDPMLRGWMQARRQRSSAGDVAWLWAALCFVLMYVDDVGAVSIDDLLLQADGSEWFVLRDGLRVRYSRAWLHFEAAIGVVMQFGHTDSMDKRVSPRFEMVFLGVTIALLSKVMFLSEEKAKSYRATVLDCVRGPRQPNGTVLVAPSALSSMMHKLLHAATVVPLGRQHLFHVMRSSKADARSAGGMKPLGAKALQELEWWAAKLQQANVVAGVPLASRTVFG